MPKNNSWLEKNENFQKKENIFMEKKRNSWKKK
jgi:hypothetical protein